MTVKISVIAVGKCEQMVILIVTVVLFIIVLPIGESAKCFIFKLICLRRKYYIRSGSVK
ncbi:MAG: hypothetical protein JJT76_03435 [Clostridiaceae bacterium]|nr:hypothetical protein [Clostridiaceae bacterium]